MVGVLPEPDLDLDEVVLGGGVPGGEGGCGGGSGGVRQIGGCSGLFFLRHRRPRRGLGEGECLDRESDPDGSERRKKGCARQKLDALVTHAHVFWFSSLPTFGNGVFFSSKISWIIKK
jgi:hypothetical protein